MIHYIDGNQLTNEVLKNTKLVLVEFELPNSIPCHSQMDILNKIEKNYANEIDVFKIDITESQNISMRFHISSVPTLLFLKGEREIERLTGLTTKEKIDEIIQELK